MTYPQGPTTPTRLMERGHPTEEEKLYLWPASAGSEWEWQINSPSLVLNFSLNIINARGGYENWQEASAGDVTGEEPAPGIQAGAWGSGLGLERVGCQGRSVCPAAGRPQSRHISGDGLMCSSVGCRTWYKTPGMGMGPWDALPSRMPGFPWMEVGGGAHLVLSN